MATIETRTSSTGNTFRIKRRQDGRWQSETFVADRRGAAMDVELHGNVRPDGWVRGHGYALDLVAPAVEDRPFGAFALQHVQDKTGLQPDTRSRYASQARQLAQELDAVVAADEGSDASCASVQNLTHRHVARWINARERNGSSPKTIANWHGLLFQILQAAVEDGLREKNPCATTGKALPKRDAYRTDEVMVFLTEPEFELIARAMWPGLADPDRGGAITAVGSVDDLEFLVTAVGTGARWGELTALPVRDLTTLMTKPKINIQRAWKRNGTGEYAREGVGRHYLGSPKTTRGRRRIPVGRQVGQILLARAEGGAPTDLVFTAVQGGPLDQPHFYEYRWQRAVALARRNGLTKTPRFHDLRHTYAAWLISAGVPLPEIQRRLGHESIQTTVDVYGGLLEQASDLADAAVDTALSWLGEPSSTTTGVLDAVGSSDTAGSSSTCPAVAPWVLPTAQEDGDVHRPAVQLHRGGGNLERAREHTA